MNTKPFSRTSALTVIPVSAFGLMLSTMPVSARDNSQPFLDMATRLQNRQERRELRREQINTLRIQNQILRNEQQVLNSQAREIRLQNNLSRPMLPASARGMSQFMTDAGKLRGLNRGVEFDLTSEERTIKLGNGIFENGQSITIKVGDFDKTYTAGSFVTPAEYLALQQSAAGSQGLVLSNTGAAVDGQVLFTSLSDGGRDIKASSLVVPVSVDAIGNFGRGSDFRVNGSLINYGNIYALSNKPESTHANINARDVLNADGALISTNVPEAISSQFGSVNSTLDLNIRADETLINRGTIDSSGNLSLSAPRIENNGSVSAQNNISISAPGDLTLINSGSLSAQNGNINFNNGIPSNIFVDNHGGLIAATNGVINFRTPDVTDVVNTSLTGGTLSASAINVNSGNGDAEIHADTIDGVLNVNSGASNISAQSASLVIGDFTTLAVTNTTIANSQGDVVLDGDVSFAGKNLAIIASGSVNAGTTTSIDLSNPTGNGGALTVLAGVDFLPATGGQIGSDTQLFTDFKASTSGGSINLGGVNVNVSSGAGRAGEVLLAANRGTNPGDILIGNIAANGTTDTSIGVQIYGNNITTGDINTVGIGGSGGVAIQSVDAPFISDDLQIQNGTIINGYVQVLERGLGSISVGSVNSGPRFLSIGTDGERITLRKAVSGYFMDVLAEKGTIDLTALTELSASTFNGFGGQMTINGKDILLNSSVTDPFELKAEGPNGNGRVSFTSGQDTVVGTPFGRLKAPGPVTYLDIYATGLEGGSINVGTTAGLTVNIDGVHNAPQGTGGDFEGASFGFSAGKSLRILGDLDASPVNNALAGRVNLTSGGNTFSLNPTRDPKNGIKGKIIGSRSTQITNTLKGIKFETSDAVEANLLSLFTRSARFGDITAAKGVVVKAQTIDFFAQGKGGIGRGKFFNVDARTLTFQSSANGPVKINNLHMNSRIGGSKIVEGLELVTAGDVELFSLRTEDGSISITSKSGTINVANGSTISANNGSVLLNQQSLSGNIVIETDSKIETAGKGGNTVIAIGAVPKKGVNTTVPTGVTVTREGKGEAYFGPGNLDVSAGNIQVNAINKNVIFNVETGATGLITVQANNIITADPPSPKSASAVVSNMYNTQPTPVFVNSSAPESLATMRSPNASIDASRAVIAKQNDLLSTINLFTTNALRTKRPVTASGADVATD